MISKIGSNLNYSDLLNACNISRKIMQGLLQKVEIGATPIELNHIASELCKKYNCEPAFFGVKGLINSFPGNVCISVNNEVLHTIPFSTRKFQSGDIVKVDFGIKFMGVFTDHCVTKIVDTPAHRDHKRLVDTSKLCVEKGIENAVVGKTVGDISFALQSVAELAGFNYVTNYCSHGIGKYLHMEPEILSYGKPNTGLKLEEGMVFTIENQITLGSAELNLDKDGWTLRSVDGSFAAMTEHMVIVRKGKAEVLTRL